MIACHHWSYPSPSTTRLVLFCRTYINDDGLQCPGCPICPPEDNCESLTSCATLRCPFPPCPGGREATCGFVSKLYLLV